MIFAHTPSDVGIFYTHQAQIRPPRTLEVWHSFGLIPLKILDEPDKSLIKAQPLTGKDKPARFDTVIVLEDDRAQSTAVQGKTLCSSRSEILSFFYFLIQAVELLA